jgi:hypothetical protein
MFILAVSVPQAVFTMYEMITVPEAIPVTTPEADMVACELFEEYQAPPPMPLEANVMPDPTQTVDAPDKLPAFANGFTVTILVATLVPHAVVTV